MLQIYHVFFYNRDSFSSLSFTSTFSLSLANQFCTYTYFHTYTIPLSLCFSFFLSIIFSPSLALSLYIDRVPFFQLKAFFFLFFKVGSPKESSFYDHLKSIFHQQIRITIIKFLPPWGLNPSPLAPCGLESDALSIRPRRPKLILVTSIQTWTLLISPTTTSQ